MFVFYPGLLHMCIVYMNSVYSQGEGAASSKGVSTPTTPPPNETLFTGPLLTTQNVSIINILDRLTPINWRKFNNLHKLDQYLGLAITGLFGALANSFFIYSAFHLTFLCTKYRANTACTCS